MKSSYKTKRSIMGFLFVLPWIIGFLLFFVQPMILHVRLAFTDMSITDTGFVLEPLKNTMDNFKYALTEDSYFTTHLITSFGGLLYKVPIIVLFSLFSAVILNQKFHGRTLMRVIFFLPIVIGCDIVMNIIRYNSNSITMSVGEEMILFNADGLTRILMMSGLPDSLVNIITTTVSSVADLVWDSAIQLLVFLIALLSIPQSYYEVATVEGAKAWETFWKITFPMVTPYVLALTVYTIIDTFTDVNNSALDYIVSMANTKVEFSRASAMSWIYFILIIAIIVIVFFLFKPFVFSKNEVTAKEVKKNGK